MNRFFSFIIFSALVTNLSAQENPTIEVGVIVGEPTGLSAKYWPGERTAFDAAAAWSFEGNGSFEVHADILYHPLTFSLEQGNLPVYVGAGPVVYLRGDTVIGTRFPIGATFLFDNIPLSLFLEVAPLVELLPETDFNVSGGLGVRVVF